MSEEWIDSKVPDLTGKTLEEIRRDPKLRAAADRLVVEMLSYPDDGVVVCCDPLRIEVPDSGSRKKR